MINISNFTSEDNPHWMLARPARPRPPSGTKVAARTRGRSLAASIGNLAAAPADRLWTIAVAACWLLINWLASIPRRLCDRLFQMNDAEAYWRGWQIAKVRGGLGRRYRDPRFDTLAACEQCRGTGIRGTGIRAAGIGATGMAAHAGAPCLPCLGTGRITISAADTTETACLTDEAG